MDSEDVTKNQTVIIRNDKIEKIWPSLETAIPDDAYQINAKDKYKSEIGKLSFFHSV